MRLEDLMIHAVILELQHTHIPVAARAGQETARLVGGPGDDVHAGGVQGEIEDLGPCCAGLAPDEDFAVVGGGGEDVAVFGVRPGDGPDCAFVSVEVGCQLVLGLGEGKVEGRGYIPF